MLQDEIRTELAVNKVFLQGCDRQASYLLCVSCALTTWAPCCSLSGIQRQSTLVNR